MTDGRSKMLVAYHEVRCRGSSAQPSRGGSTCRAALLWPQASYPVLSPAAAPAAALPLGGDLQACMHGLPQLQHANKALPSSLCALQVGHAVCASMTPGHDPVQKVTLIPRGQAKGLTWFIPGEDPSLISKQQVRRRSAPCQHSAAQGPAAGPSSPKPRVGVRGMADARSVPVPAALCRAARVPLSARLPRRSLPASWAPWAAAPPRR